MKVVIAKVTEVYFEGEAYSLTVPGTEGVLTVLGHHEPLVTTLKAGDIVIKEAPNTKGQVFSITSGILEVHAQGATVLL